MSIEEMKVGDDLFVRVVQGSALREQDVNAQVMEPSKFERLVENVRQRGALESLPYVHRPNDEGPMSIISGHHRARAARAAGLKTFPVLVDTAPMARSLVRAKQIAHNEISGSPDQEILRRMIEEIDNVDDLLVSALPEEVLNAAYEEVEPVPLDLPRVDFEWRTVQLMFLPKQLERFEDLVDAMERQTEMIGVADVEQFKSFSKALIDYGYTTNIKSMSAVVDVLTSVALRELERAQEEQEAEQESVGRES